MNLSIIKWKEAEQMFNVLTISFSPY